MPGAEYYFCEQNEKDMLMVDSFIQDGEKFWIIEIGYHEGDVSRFVYLRDSEAKKLGEQLLNGGV